MLDEVFGFILLKWTELPNCSFKSVIESSVRTVNVEDDILDNKKIHLW